MANVKDLLVNGDGRVVGNLSTGGNATINGNSTVSGTVTASTVSASNITFNGQAVPKPASGNNGQILVSNGTSFVFTNTIDCGSV